MRYFIDEEFIEDGHTIDLISIGIVCEDGRELYLQSTEFNPRKASKWVQENVLPHLTICPYTIGHEYESGGFAFDPMGTALRHHKNGQCIDQIYGIRHRCPWRTREQLMRDVRSFFNPSDGFELWGWCAGYDWVAFCQLFGTMMDLPAGWPHYIRDIQYLLDERGISDDELPKQEEGLHTALADARHIKKIWETLVSPSFIL